MRDLALAARAVDGVAGQSNSTFSLLIAELAMSVEFGASSEDVARTSHAHPTLT